MATIEHVPVEAMDPYRFGTVLSPAQYEQLLDLIENGARELRGRVIWNVNSTAKGGGVVELLRPLLGYSRGAGVDARWVVVAGRPEFFTLTKRIHNHLHGFDGDGGPLGDAEREIYEDTLADNAREFSELVSPQDIVILHDPQTAGLVSAVSATGARIVWRCHVGLDQPNDTPERRGISCARTSRVPTATSFLARASPGRVLSRRRSRSFSRRSMRLRRRTRSRRASSRWRSSPAPACSRANQRTMPCSRAQTGRPVASTGKPTWSRSSRCVRRTALWCRSHAGTA